eukprot:283407-Amphidinium_carterae.1
MTNKRISITTRILEQSWTFLALQMALTADHSFTMSALTFQYTRATTTVLLHGSGRTEFNWVYCKATPMALHG